MSKFYGTVQGAAETPATRRGTRDIKVSAQSYDGSVITRLTYEDDKLMVELSAGVGSTTFGDMLLFRGTFEDFVNAISKGGAR